MIIIGTAGWSIPRVCARRVPGADGQLPRYARVLRGVEINSSFHRDHARETYARWARQVPRNFRFAVKLPRLITHEQRLRATRRPLQVFLGQVEGLGSRLGPLVVQLPPSLPFEPRVARGFFSLLRDLHEGPLACEPRHASWFEARADELLVRHRVGRIAADPAVVPKAAQPGGWPGIAYYRLHGTPRKYWSVYEKTRLVSWTAELQRLPKATLTWCVFDNTASGGALVNALQVKQMLESRREKR